MLSLVSGSVICDFSYSYFMLIYTLYVRNHNSIIHTYSVLTCSTLLLFMLGLISYLLGMEHRGNQKATEQIQNA
jgi:hypothetical protein